MGFQTTLGILNDQWDYLRRNPKEIVAAIDAELCRGPHYCNGISVLPIHHADDAQLCLSWGNMLVEISPGGLKDMGDDLRERIISQAKMILSWTEEMVDK